MQHHFPFLIQPLQIEEASLGAELTERREGVGGEEWNGGRRKKRGGKEEELTLEELERRGMEDGEITKAK